MSNIKEVGFWDYSAVQHGSLEQYTESDWDCLIEDMAEHGINSFVLSVKWMTTGYRSRYNWLDQNPSSSAIKTDNRTIHYALEQMQKRSIKTWLLAVVTQFPKDIFGLGEVWTADWTYDAFGYGVGYYDVDHPGLLERVNDMMTEICELFGSKTDGIILEIEFADREEPHRIPLYNEWAAINNRPDYDKIKRIDLQPRAYPFYHWRDFATHRRIEFIKQVEKAIRNTGFQGTLATINEIELGFDVAISGSNLRMIKEELPEITVVTYDGLYDRSLNRLATCDLCMQSPLSLGIKTHFLSRGVMPWGNDPKTFGSLERQWDMTIEDCQRYQPDALWFMGSDCRVPGYVCSLEGIRRFGYRDGREARLKLLNKIKLAALID